MHSVSSPTIHLFVFDTVTDWEAKFILAAIQNAQRLTAPYRYRVVTAAANGGPITTIGGKRIKPDVALDAVTPDGSAMLILPGGHAWDLGANAEALQLASHFIASGTPVAAMRSAMVALTRAGMLDRLRLTGSTREYLISSGHRGAGFYCGVPAGTDEGAASMAGVGPIDFAREIFKMLNVSTAPATGAWLGALSSGDRSQSRPLSTN
jgi:putative intracellular protease/amidase